MSEIDQSQLDEVAEAFSEAMRRGENPSVDAYVARYPELAESLRPLLTSIALIEGIKVDSKRSGPVVAAHQLRIEQLDDYRIVREIGRGGMGVVLEAIDQSLHRRVAIKVLPESLVSEKRHVDRFRQESKAAARLRHPGIVSVFGVGQSGPYHYYVMDYIDGINLRQWIDGITQSSSEMVPTRDDVYSGTDGDLRMGDTWPSTSDSTKTDFDVQSLPTSTDSPSYYRWVAKLGCTICDALDYAHQQHTLHRDIKPANLLIDAAGNVSITDFGLAKVAEHQRVTQTGDVVGTPQYMPPESFEGTYDVQSEVYAVALTLYELLTLRPAFSSKSPAELIRKASEGVKQPPRKLNANIPVQLETIVMKALALEPSQRYSTAAKLRDDLNNFLCDLPIEAKRTGVVGRTLLWTRRQPVVASLTLATFASLLALAVVSAAAYFRTRSALNSAQEASTTALNALKQRGIALEAAETQRQRAEANLAVAVEAFEKIREEIWQRGMIPDADVVGEIAETASADVSPADAEILQSLLGFFDKLAASNSSDLRAQSAAAGRYAGDIYQRLGQLGEADAAYNDAVKRYQAIANENPSDTESVITQARILNELIVTSSVQGQIPRASSYFDKSVRVLEESDAAMQSADGRYEYARAHILFASSLSRAGVETPMRRLRPLANPPGRRRNPAGQSLRSTARSGEEIVAIVEGIDQMTSLVEDFPDETRYAVALAAAYRDRSKVAFRAGMRAESDKAIKTSIDQFESLLDQDRRSKTIRYELAKTLSSSEALSFNQMFRLLRADTLSSDLLEHDPSQPRYQTLRAHVLERLAHYRGRLGGKPDVAEKNLLAALELHDQLVKTSPDSPTFRVQRAQALDALADLKIKSGQREAGLRYLEQAIRELQTASRGKHNSPIIRQNLQRLRQKQSRISNP